MRSGPRPVAIILARGGSRRVPGKNVRLFRGKPIIRYAIEAARESKVFDEVMVFTDDARIACVAKAAGAVVPFRRSKRNAGDHGSFSGALIEALRAYEAVGRKLDYFAHIMATAVLLAPESLREADALMRRKNADSVVAVTRFGFPIQRALRIKAGRLSAFTPAHFFKRSQDLEPAYHDCGQFFFCKTRRFIADGRALSGRTYALEIQESRAQDIDSEEDWRIAELKYELLRR